MQLRMALAAALVLATSIFSLAAEKKPKLTQDQAKAIALQKHAGTIKSSELEKEHGKLVYSFDIQTSQGIWEVQVDAMTGSIVEDKTESAADEAREAALDRQQPVQPSKQKPTKNTDQK